MGSGQLAGKKKGRELAVGREEKRERVGIGQLAGERSGEFLGRKGWGGLVYNIPLSPIIVCQAVIS